MLDCNHFLIGSSFTASTLLVDIVELKNVRATQVGNAVAPFFAEFLGHLLIQIDKDSHER